MRYGRAVKIARAIAGLEQRELAKLAGIDPSHISLIERGKRNPTVATLEKIARPLGLPYHILTLLASESKDLKNVRPSEVRELGEILARALLIGKDVNRSKPKKSRSGRRSKA